MTRVGASQVFFNIVAGFNARKLIQDHKAAMTVMKAVQIDSFEAMLKPVEDLSAGLNVMLQDFKKVSQEVGFATVEFEKFYDNADRQKSMAADIKDIGLAYGVVAQEALIAGARAAQVGQLIGEENIPLLVEQAEILHQISDLTSEEAMKGIISLQQQTGVLYGDLNSKQFQRLSQLDKEIILTQQSAYALDSLNTIANKSVAVEGQLVEVMTNFASQGALVGEAFHEMATLSAVLLESGEQAGAAGRGLRMMYARLGGNIGNARTEMEQLGFTIRKENGDLLTMTEIIQQLKDKGWDRFSQSMKQNIAQTVAGNRHYVRFIKLMENQERVVQLNVAALEDIDSAAGQAQKAMENYANQLKIAEATGENLKGELGEVFTPFMVGQQEAKNEFMAAQSAMFKAMPEGWLKVFGRMAGFMKVTGAFVKLGLGVQTMGIGMNMFDAVQRDLHGILIANENLHSKQPTYQKFGIKLDKDKNRILGHVRYNQQLLNREMEKQTHLQTMINHLDLTKIPQEEKNRQNQEYVNHLYRDRLQNGQKRVIAQTQLNALNNDNLNTVERQNILIREDMANIHSEINLLSTFKDIKNTTQTSDMAFRRQMLLDSETMKLLGRDDLQAMRDKKKLLQEQQGIFQRLVADNERLRGLRETGRGGIMNPEAMKESGKALRHLGVEMENIQKKIDDLGEANENEAPWSKQKRSDYEYYQRAIVGLNEEMKNFIATNNVLATQSGEQLAKTKEAMKENKTWFTAWSDTAFAGAAKMASKATGHIMHLDSNFLKLNGTLYDSDTLLTEIAARENLIETASNDLNLALQMLTDSREELSLSEFDAFVIGDLLAQSIDDQATSSDKLARIQEILEGTIKATKEEWTELTAETLKQYDQKMLKATEASRKFGFALTNVSAMVLPAFFGGTKNAAVATTTLTMSLAPAVVALMKSAGAMAANQWDAFIAGITGSTESLKKYLLSATLMVGATLALAAATYNYMKNQEEINALLKEAEDLNNTRSSQMEHIQNQQNLFAEGSVLEGMLDYNYALKDLISDEQLLAQVMADLDNLDTVGFNQSQLDAIDNSKDLLTLLKSVNDETIKSYDQHEQGRKRQEIADEFSGVYDESEQTLDEWWSAMSGTAQEQKDRHDAIKQLDRDMGGALSDESSWEVSFFGAGLGRYSVDVEEFSNSIAKYIDEGNQLSTAQMDVVAETLEGYDDILAMITYMNENVITAGDKTWITELAGTDTEIDDTAEAVADVVAEIDNLTDSIYDFGGAREELFFGGKYGNVTGSLYKQVVKQGVGVLYNKMDIVMANNFHGFFNEEEAAHRILAVLNNKIDELTSGA